MDEAKKNFCDRRGMCTAEMFTDEETGCRYYTEARIFPYPGACAMHGMNGTCMSPHANNHQLPVGSGPQPLRKLAPQQPACAAQSAERLVFEPCPLNLLMSSAGGGAR